MKHSAHLFRGIRGKIFFVVFIPLLSLLMVNGFSFYMKSRLTHWLDAAYEKSIPYVEVLNKMALYRAQMTSNTWGALANPENKELQNTMVKRGRENLKWFSEAQTEYESLLTGAEKEKYQPVQETKALFYSTYNKIYDLISNGTPEDFTEAKRLLGTDGQIVNTTVRKAVDESLAFYTEQAKQDRKDYAIEGKTFAMIANIITVLSILVVLIVAYIQGQSIAKKLNNVVDTLNHVTETVSNSVKSLSESGKDLSESSTQSAAALEETVASLEEVNSIVSKNAEEAKAASSLSNESLLSAQQGKAEMEKLLASMHEIRSSSHKIEEIITVIDDIAFQTNLLALNASVEAARAGEQGKGFAVVADAVRGLAQRSAIAAKDISGLIHESVEKINQGVMLSEKNGQTLEKIATSVRRVAEYNQNISVTSAEQQQGINEITKAMNQLDQSSQKNAASSEEIAGNALELSQQTQEIHQNVIILSTEMIGTKDAA